MFFDLVLHNKNRLEKEKYIFWWRCKSFHLEKLLKQIFGQEFITCQTVDKILLENQLTAKLKILQLSVIKSCEI